jgi:hypothetical protein
MPAASLLRQGSRFHDFGAPKRRDCNNERLRVGVESWLSWCFKFREPKEVVASSSRLSISYRLPNQP